MDHGGEVLIDFVGAHCNALELLELAEQVFDEMPLLVSRAMLACRPKCQQRTRIEVSETRRFRCLKS
jgi:hypothetical protein